MNKLNIYKENAKQKSPWYHQFKHYINNRWLQLILTLLLLALLVLVSSKISHLLRPIFQFFGTITFPLVLAGVFYYLNVPLVNFLEKKFNLSRFWGAWLVLFLVIIFFVVFFTWLPIIFTQSQDFIENWIKLFNDYNEQILALNQSEWVTNALTYVEKYVSNWLQTNSTNWGQIWNSAITSIGSVVGKLTNFVLAIVTAPIILFYFLKDGPRFSSSISKYLPNKIRKQTMQLLTDINRQISYYVRGQIMVGIAVAIMFAIGYAIIGLPYGILLGMIAGVLNLIPYLGSFLAIIPAVIIGFVASPWMAAKVLIVFSIEQTIESRIISPQILGSNLDIHPVTIMLLLIAGGNTFGFLGIIFIIPAYAVLKVIFLNFFIWYRNISGLYEEDIAEEKAEQEEKLLEERYNNENQPS